MQVRLIDFINKVPSSRPFIITEERIFSYGEISNYANSVKQTYPELLGHNCAIISNDKESLAVYLPALDAICTRLFLQPADLRENTDKFYSSAQIDYVITVSNLEIISIEKTRLRESLETEGHERHEYLLATSGTTGTPKLAKYELKTLLATTIANTNKGLDFRWALTYDVNRFAGLQVYLQAVASGSSLIVASNQTSISKQVELYSKYKVNCISATPSFWRQLLMAKEHRDIPLHRITLGGEVSSQTVLTALSKAYTNAKITHIYASTEAGVGFPVKDGLEGFPMSYLTSGVFEDIDLKVVDGLLWVKSRRGCNKLFLGNLDIDKSGFINTGDKVQIDKALNRVFFLGRDSGSINIGGNKVMPEKVEFVLESHKSVALAKVFAKKSAVLGSLIAAEVVVSSSEKCADKKALKADIMKHCKAKLNAYELPAIFKFVESIETNSTGKKLRGKCE